MPWTTADVDGFKKGLSAKGKRQWVAVANSALSKCLAGGGSQNTCEASAIKQANGTVKEADVPDLKEFVFNAGEGASVEVVFPYTGTWRYDPGANGNVQNTSGGAAGNVPSGEWVFVPPLEEAKTKKVSGRTHSAGDFLVVEDSDEPSTWHLPVKVQGKPDHRLMGAAKAALTVGYRGNKYGGPDKGKALTKLRALYKAEKMPWKERLVLEEIAQSLNDLSASIKGAFYALFDPPRPDQPEAATRGYRFFCRDVYMDHPTFGDAVVVEKERSRELYLVPFQVDQGSVTFDAPEQWEQVRLTYEPIGEAQPTGDLVELAESASGHALALTEAAPDPNSLVPLHLDVALITPGWGNKRDNHFYPADVVARDAAVFEGAKMYESDHRQQEKSTRTWVSTVQEVKGFTDDGSPIAQVSVHDRNFAERLVALNADNLLGRMECSILANGKAKRGEVDGRKGKIVEAITSAESVDWVTKAGAGGRALALSEREHGGDQLDETQTNDALGEGDGDAEDATFQEEDQDPEPTPTVDPTRVQELVEATNLPPASKARLAEASYPTEDALQGAIDGEVAYVKELLGSGKPFAQGPSDAEPELTPEQLKERADARWDRIRGDVGLIP